MNSWIDSWIFMNSHWSIHEYPWISMNGCWGWHTQLYRGFANRAALCSTFPQIHGFVSRSKKHKMNIFVNPWMSHSTIHELVSCSKKHAALNSWTSSQFMNSCHAARSTQLWIHELCDNSWIQVTQQAVLNPWTLWQFNGFVSRSKKPSVFNP